MKGVVCRYAYVCARPQKVHSAPPHSSKPHTHWGPVLSPAMLTWQQAAPGRGRGLDC